MGNVGQTGFTCNEANLKNVFEKDKTHWGNVAKFQATQYKTVTDINLNCGLGSKIGKLIMFGLANNMTSNCGQILDNVNHYKSAF